MREKKTMYINGVRLWNMGSKKLKPSVYGEQQLPYHLSNVFKFIFLTSVNFFSFPYMTVTIIHMSSRLRVMEALNWQHKTLSFFQQLQFHTDIYNKTSLVSRYYPSKRIESLIRRILRFINLLISSFENLFLSVRIFWMFW